MTKAVTMTAAIAAAMLLSACGGEAASEYSQVTAQSNETGLAQVNMAGMAEDPNNHHSEADLQTNDLGEAPAPEPASGAAVARPEPAIKAEPPVVAPAVASRPEAPRGAPKALPKATPKEEVKAAPAAAAKAPAATPPCAPEHRAMGHCK